jgi:hypothetical protein
MQPEWIKIFSSPLLFKVELARQLLEENGIESVVVNKQDSSLLVYGEAELHVPKESVETALEVLKNVEGEQDENSEA